MKGFENFIERSKSRGIFSNFNFWISCLGKEEALMKG